MKHQVIEIGFSPSEEDCAQVGAEDYRERSRKEMKAFRSQILRHYPIPHELQEQGKAGIQTSSVSHDFGSYRELVLSFDGACEEAWKWAMLVEEDPECAMRTWDHEAQRELGLCALVEEV